MNQGIVIKSTGSHYLVKQDDKITNCKIRGKFRRKEFRTTNPVAVGDVVDFKLQKDGDIGVITGIHDRKNCLLRKSTNLSKQFHVIAANIDYAFLMITLIKPVTYSMFIDRWLVACEKSKIKAVLIFNKTDLYDDEIKKKLNSYIKIYKKIGYHCLKTSVKENSGIDVIRKMIKNKTIVISGNSGVGKSGLINLLEPGLNLKISEISAFHEQGKHTTTFAEMFPVAGGFIIDTPGIKGFGLDEEIKEHLSDYFPEIKQLSDACKFNNCTHTHEPECAVKEAVDKGAVSSQRYNNYLNILAGEEDKYRQDNYI
ncbi:MAG: ribosome small subunit-dependent GTPase A [Bacteroidetes bacterium]|nr:ribosome small subunit-dependent GTPase A [Bacteroidales bacterium]RLD49996.1 MAG: ribosome small subunit-dependent GTPase A [Bacteroidota bacterium]